MSSYLIVDNKNNKILYKDIDNSLIENCLSDLDNFMIVEIPKNEPHAFFIDIDAPLSDDDAKKIIDIIKSVHKSIKVFAAKRTLNNKWHFITNILSTKQTRLNLLSYFGNLIKDIALPDTTASSLTTILCSRLVFNKETKKWEHKYGLPSSYVPASFENIKIDTSANKLAAIKLFSILKPTNELINPKTLNLINMTNPENIYREKLKMEYKHNKNPINLIKDNNTIRHLNHDIPVNPDLIFHILNSFTPARIKNNWHFILKCILIISKHYKNDAIIDHFMNVISPKDKDKYNHLNNEIILNELLETNDLKITYKSTISVLFKFALKDNKKQLHKLLNLKENAIIEELIQSTPPYELQTQTAQSSTDSTHINDIPLNKNIYISAGMGMGKSIAVINLIKATFEHNQKAKVVLVLPRLSLINKYIIDITAIDYNNIQPPTLIIYNQAEQINGVISTPQSSIYITTVESLHRLKTEQNKPDLLILDEIEMTITQFNSGLHGRNTMFNFATFHYLIRISKQKVFLDAFPSQKTFSWLNRTFPNIAYELLTYTYKNLAKQSFIIYNNKQKWLNEINTALENNLKIIIPANSKKLCTAIHDILKKKYPNKSVKLFTSDQEYRFNGDDKSLECDILIYSPTISVGISYVKLHFNKVFAYFNNQSTDIRNSLQMLFRCRQIKDNAYNILIEERPSNLPTSHKEIIENFISHRNDILDTNSYQTYNIEVDDEGITRFKTNDLFNLQIDNDIMQFNDRNIFLPNFISMVKFLGCQITTYNKINQLNETLTEETIKKTQEEIEEEKLNKFLVDLSNELDDYFKYNMLEEQKRQQELNVELIKPLNYKLIKKQLKICHLLTLQYKEFAELLQKNKQILKDAFTERQKIKNLKNLINFDSNLKYEQAILKNNILKEKDDMKHKYISDNISKIKQFFDILNIQITENGTLNQKTYKREKIEKTISENEDKIKNVFKNTKIKNITLRYLLLSINKQLNDCMLTFQSIETKNKLKSTEYKFNIHPLITIEHNLTKLKL